MDQDDAILFRTKQDKLSRYRSCYIQRLVSLDRTHPGCKELIEIKGVSVQAQDQYPLRTAFDQRGEQTLNRKAKSVGGIGRFGGNIDSSKICRRDWQIWRKGLAGLAGKQNL